MRKLLFAFCLTMITSLQLIGQFPFNLSNFDSLSIANKSNKLKLTSFAFLQNDTTSSVSTLMDTSQVLIGLVNELSKYYGTLVLSKQYQEVAAAMSRGVRASEKSITALTKATYFDYAWATLPKDSRLSGKWTFQTADSSGVITIATDMLDNSELIIESVNGKASTGKSRVLLFTKEMFLITELGSAKNVLFYWSPVQQTFVSYNDKGQLTFIGRKTS